MEILIDEKKRICYACTPSLRTARVLERLENTFDQRLKWDTELAGMRRVTEKDGFRGGDDRLSILISDRAPGIYVSDCGYVKQIASRASLCSGLALYTARQDAQNRIELGIGKTEDADAMYFWLKQTLLRIPHWI